MLISVGELGCVFESADGVALCVEAFSVGLWFDDFLMVWM